MASRFEAHHIRSVTLSDLCNAVTVQAACNSVCYTVLFRAARDTQCHPGWLDFAYQQQQQKQVAQLLLQHASAAALSCLIE